MGVRTTVKLYFARPTFDNEVYSCFTPAGGGILMISGFSWDALWKVLFVCFMSFRDILENKYIVITNMQ